MDQDIKKVFDKFCTEGSFHSAKNFGSGHIHDTFFVKNGDPGKDDFILQKLNNKIFKNIPELQSNIERVTGHIRSKLSAIPGRVIKRECLTLVFTHEGKSYTIDEDGKYWRMYLFIPDHKSYDIVDTQDKAFEGGKAIGRFQAMLADLGDPPLFDTIPWFHDIGKRLETFYNTLERNPAGRRESAKKEIEFVRKRADEMKIILNLGNEGIIPLRITHNDTKFNNILLDKNDKALCVIDLDTVMPGYVHYDFGDAIRTATNMAAEDEKDLSKVKMNIDLFKAYAKGYLSETSSTLNVTEKEYLAFAPKLITFTIGLRFLTDYIDGDNYFKIHHEHHNLQRAKAQFRLVESMEEQYNEMKKIIKQLA
jgi:thiamine kinase-like enzyme